MSPKFLLLADGPEAFAELLHEPVVQTALRKVLGTIPTQSLKAEPPPPQKWLRITEAAEYLGVAVSTLYDWTSRRQIAHTKMGRQLQFSLEELDKFRRQSIRTPKAVIHQRADDYLEALQKSKKRR